MIDIRYYENNVFLLVIPLFSNLTVYFFSCLSLRLGPTPPPPAPKCMINIYTKHISSHYVIILNTNSLQLTLLQERILLVICEVITYNRQMSQKVMQPHS